MNTKALMAVCCSIWLMSAAYAESAPVNKTEAALREAQSQLFKALVKKDIPAMRKILADDLTYTHSTAVVQSKDEFIADLISGAMDYRSIDVVEQKLRQVGNLGLFNGTVHLGVFKAEADRSFDVRFTDVFVQRNGSWQLVAWQSTRIGPPPPGAPPGAVSPAAAK